MAQFNLLSSSNPKIEKSQQFGWITFILHLAPAMASGYQTCPNASEGCKAGCLFKSGMARIFRHINIQRIKKTKLFFENREKFMRLLVADIIKACKVAKKYKMKPCFRLNGTSDIRWETVKCEFEGIRYNNLFDAFPNVQFYDYTKILNRKVSEYPNYHLTFSSSESNRKAVRTAINRGMNVAVVFGVNKGEPLPERYYGKRVVNGDISDLRFLDDKGVIIGLYAKGNAKYDETGFVKRDFEGSRVALRRPLTMVA